MSAATILLNVRAGALRAKTDAEQLREICAELGVEADVVGTESPQQMVATIRRLVQAGAERIVVAGGDGADLELIIPMRQANRRRHCYTSCCASTVLR